MSRIYDFKENIKKDELKEIATAIVNGQIVVFPTETVYGIGADATNYNAVEKIFKAKGRPQDNPLIVHISNMDMLKSITTNVNEIEYTLMKNFWPGPLTIILNSNGKVASNVTASLDTVGIRMPDNEISLNIIESANVPIAAPSANISGKPSGTCIDDIYDELNNKVDIFVDGSNTNIGIESTVVKVQDNEVLILRPGKISLEDIKALGLNVKLDEHIFKPVEDKSKVMSPGMKHRHYSPQTKTILVKYNDDDSAMYSKIQEYVLNNRNKNIGILCFDEHMKYLNDLGLKLLNIGSKYNMQEISSNLFSKLREIDKYNLDLCLIEGVKEENIGTAILNRLIRACEYNLI